ncbi:MAG: DUF4157 domain-containing protein [Deltaproteobacteria bacterium]|nr:DUF4157 domain-containing protein [Deltaproteobacteria bacterium]
MVSQATEVAARSQGRALPADMRASMQQSFGDRDLSGVRIHEDGAAGRASEMLNARAFTQGQDIYFGQGEKAGGDTKLLAHELAHTLQNRTGAGAGGPQAKGRTEHSVTTPGQGSEIAAERAAETVTSGGVVKDVGSPSPGVARDAMGDLNQTLGGNWLGSVDGAQALERFRALSEAERGRVVTDDAFDAQMRRLSNALDGRQLTELFALVPRNVCDLRWKVYWIVESGKGSSFSAEQWRWTLAYSSPEEWTSLRAYDAGYRLLFRHAPADLIPHWDLLDGLHRGLWTGAADAVRNAVNSLNPDQRTRVLGDAPRLASIIRASGNAQDAYRTLTYLNATIRQTCEALDTAGHLASLTRGDWSAMFGTAQRAEVDAFVAGNAAVWARVVAACPADVISQARASTQRVDDGTGTGTTVANINQQLADPVQLQALLTSMGSVGFLGLCNTAGASPAANYALVKGANKVADVVNGLPRGARMGERTCQHLRTWFFAETASVPLASAMLSARFNFTTGGTGSYTHASLGPWDIAGLHQCWPVLERLPPAHVEGNDRLMHMLRNPTGGDGAAYYGNLINDPNRQSGDVVMGYSNVNAQRTDAGFGPGVFSANGRGPGTAQVPINIFNATMRHEIGHAVDRQLNLMQGGWMTQDSAGNWIKYSSYVEMVDAIIAAGGGLTNPDGTPRHGYPAADVGQYRQAMINALANGTTFQAALTALKPTAVAAPDAGPIAAVFQTARWTGGGSGPWYNPGNWKPQGGRCFQRAYGDAGSLYSFKDNVRTSRGVTQYQWRAPGEWFAEIYQVYYAEQEQGGNRPVGGILRSRDASAAELMTNVVDRGHSPQAMRDGTTRRAPGT